MSYELSTIGNRVSANFLDTIIATTLFVLLGMLFPYGLIPKAFWGFSVVSIWMYHLIWTVFGRGITPGMRIIGTRIIKPSGNELQISDLMLRWIARPLDITMTCCALGIFLMIGTEKRQRLGDILAGTVLVKTRPAVHFSLDDILRFHEKTLSHSIEYPEARYLREQDVLIIKNLLNNEGGYNDHVLSELLTQSQKRLEQMLNIVSRENESRRFLQKIVNDYIVITR